MSATPAALAQPSAPTVPLHAKTLTGPQKVAATLPISVHTTDGHTYGAKRIRLGWNDQLQIVGPSGKVTHVSATKIAKIEDADGNDLTQVVLAGHEVIGTESGTADSLNAMPMSEVALAESVRPPRRPPLGGLVVQGAYLFRVGQSKSFVDTGYGADAIARVVWQAELGGMGRVSEKYGVGLSALLGGNEDFTLVGIKARVRRTLGSNTQLDLATGYMRQTPTNGDLWDSKCFVGEVTLVSNGWIGASTQFQTVKLDTPDGGTTTEFWWYAGPRFMGLPGIPAAIVSLLAIVITQYAD